MSFSNGGGRDHFANINSLNSVGGDFEPPVSENDLSLFTNTEFFDWDVNGSTDDAFDPLTASSNFNFNDIPQIPNDTFDPSIPQQWPVQTEGTSSAPAQPQQQPQQRAQQPTRKRADTGSRSGPSPTSESPAAEGDPLSVSAEEDKRRRNTAASARFRVKKKQREQAMEKTAKEMTDRVHHLETRISELEKENTLLRTLVTEKGGSSAASKAEEGSGRGKRLKRELESP